MALANYSELLTETQSYLFNRGDLVGRIPTFIRLFEAKANRELRCRQMEERATAEVDLLSLAPEFISLPSDFHSMRRIRLLDVPGKPRLKFMSSAQLDAEREKCGDQPGQPVWFTVVGDEIELLPTPATAHTIEMTYRKYVPPLTVVDTTNWLLALAPDGYLYGTLMEAAPYLYEDERITVWGAGLKGVFDGLNTLGDVSSFNAGPLVVRRRRSY